MRRFILAAVVAASMFLTPAGAKDKESKDEKPSKESPVIATVNGEPVTKAEWSTIWKADQWHAAELKNQSAFHGKMQGKPYEDFFFGEEVVKIRVMAQRYKDELPQMKKAIDAIHAKVASGEDFAALAKQYSQDPGSAAAGGSLGEPKELHQMVFPFNRIALGMKEGEISDPILTIFGYHILKVDRVMPPSPSEGKGKRVEVRNILIRFSSADPRAESEDLASKAKVEVLDKGMCKKLVSYCSQEG